MTRYKRPLSYPTSKTLCFLNKGFMGIIEKTYADLYVLNVHDSDHDLWANIPLETQQVLALSEEEGAYLTTVASCHLSSLNHQMLAERTGFSDQGQRVVLFLFQLKVLEHLFYFCESQEAEKLLITVNEANLDYLEIYSPFFASEESLVNENGDHQVQVTIPTDPATYEDLLDFTTRLEQDFRRILWQEQRDNPTVRDYLKHHACV